jgi:hypothetical protein
MQRSGAPSTRACDRLVAIVAASERTNSDGAVADFTTADFTIVEFAIVGI